MSHGVVLLLERKCFERDAKLEGSISDLIDGFWRSEVVQRGRVPRRHPSLVDFGRPLAQGAAGFEIELSDADRERVARELSTYVPLSVGPWAAALLGRAGRELRLEFSRRISLALADSDPDARLGWWTVALASGERSPPVEIRSATRPLYELLESPSELNEIVLAPCRPIVRDLAEAEALDALARRLQPAGVELRGLVEDARPRLAEAWSWMARMSTPVRARVPEEDFAELGQRWWALCDELGVFIEGPSCLLGVAGPLPWIAAEIPDRATIVEHVGPLPDEPAFLVYAPTAGVLVGLDTEEWEFRLFAARVVDGEIVDVNG